MPLDTHTRNRRALGNEPSEQYHRTGVFGTALNVVVVVIQLGLRVGFVGPFEGQGQEFGADDARPVGRTQILRGGGLGIAAVVDGFVDDVPSLDAALVAAHHGHDVCLEALHQQLARHSASRPGLKEPVGRLGNASRGCGPIP